MLELPTVTLCCIDTANHRLALRALDLSRSAIRFARILLLTDTLPPGVPAPPGIDVDPIAPLRTRDDYSQFVLKDLLAHVTTHQVLLIQWDGYVINPAAWEDAFLQCDYLGAKWFWHEDGMRVGNGGFSLRSRKLLVALQDPRITLVGNEDTTICRTFRPLLEREHAIRFGDDALADRFAFEAAYPIGKPFGFHGLFNFCRTVPPDEIAVLAPEFSDAIAKSPQLFQLLKNCCAMGQWKAAVAIGRRILAASPNDPGAASLLKSAEQHAATPLNVGRNEPCPCGSGRKFKQCHGALNLRSESQPPPDADALARAALTAHRTGELDAAETGYRAALAIAPDHPLAMHYLGVVLYQRNRLDEAMPLLERAAAAAPLEPDFHKNLGLALAAADRNDDAEACHRRALALQPDDPATWNNLGLTLQAAGRIVEAIAAFREAVRRVPEFAPAHWNLSLALLLRGEFEEGWREYEWRLEIPELGRKSHALGSPRWDGVIRPGLTLLVMAEQGLGDALQFVRFAEPLARQGIRVIVSGPGALVRLLASAPGVATAVDAAAEPPTHDAHIPLLSLPGVLGVRSATIPANVPYLRVDAQLRARAAAILATQPDALRVGVAWAGRSEHFNDRRRSMTLGVLAPLFAIPGIAWFSLQKGEAAAQIARLPATITVAPLPDECSFDETAALVSELDLVISVDTSIAHLAGALARPAWILLPFAPDFRWQLDRADSPWYPTLRLFRQAGIGDWASVVARVEPALRAMARHRDDATTPGA